MRIRDAQNNIFYKNLLNRWSASRRNIGLQIHETKSSSQITPRDVKIIWSSVKGESEPPPPSLPPPTFAIWSACARQFFSSTDISGLRREPTLEITSHPFSLIALGSPDFEPTIRAHRNSSGVKDETKGETERKQSRGVNPNLFPGWYRILLTTSSLFFQRKEFSDNLATAGTHVATDK